MNHRVHLTIHKKFSDLNKIKTCRQMSMNECYTTICHMTRSKVNVMEV